MLYFLAARLLAVVAIVFGVVSVSFGVAVATDSVPTEAISRYWPRETSGSMIDKGIWSLIAAVVLGTLGEIGFGIRKLLTARRD